MFHSCPVASMPLAVNEHMSVHACHHQSGLQKRVTTRLLSPRHHWCHWEMACPLGPPWDIAIQSASGLTLSSFQHISLPRVLYCLLGQLTISTLLPFQAFRTLQQQVYQSSVIFARLLNPVFQGSAPSQWILAYSVLHASLLGQAPSKNNPRSCPLASISKCSSHIRTCLSPERLCWDLSHHRLCCLH